MITLIGDSKREGRVEKQERLTIPAERVRPLLLYLDGLRFACAICASGYNRAVLSLRNFEREPIAAVTAEQAIAVLADLWSVVDAAHRVRILVTKMPYRKAISSEYEIFERNTRVVEELRNYIQHLDEEISRLEKNATPVWGSISWQGDRDPTISFTLIAGSTAVAQTHHSLVWDRLERKFVRPMEICVGTTIFDVLGVVKSVERLEGVLSRWCATFSGQDGKQYVFAPDKIPIIATKVSAGEV
jgi:hypothetical protein